MIKPSLCICISGQMRNFEEAFEALSKLIEPFDATVVVSTWRRRGGKVHGALNANQLRRLFSDEVCRSIPPDFYYSAFYRLLPGLESAISNRALLRGLINEEDIHRFFPNSIIDIEDDLEIFPGGIGNLPMDERNMYLMFYKIAKANQIKNSLEFSRGRPFDVVLRVRPDLIPSFVIPSTVGRDEVILDWVDFDIGVAGDTVVIGSSHSLNVYADLVNVFIEREGFSTKWDHHFEIYRHLTRHGMELSRLPHRNQFSDERVPDDLFVTAIREAPRPSSEIARQLDAVCLNIRANAALTRGEHSTAKQDALSAIEICPEFAGPHWCLSCASEAIGDIRQAYVSIVDAINCCEAGFRRGNSNWDLANFPFIGEQLRGLCQRHASALNIMVELEHAFIKEPRSATLNALLSKILAARADVSGTKNSVE